MGMLLSQVEKRRAGALQGLVQFRQAKRCLA